MAEIEEASRLTAGRHTVAGMLFVADTLEMFVLDKGLVATKLDHQVDQLEVRFDTDNFVPAVCSFSKIAEANLRFRKLFVVGMNHC